ncbi:MAG: transposase [Patescibacteria group bacterium]
MPGRTTILATGEIYHILNRGIALQPTFLDKRDYQRAKDTLFYYQNSQPPLRYSKFLTLVQEERNRFLNNLRKNKQFLIEIIAYCLMPNHFHLLARQIMDNGISAFASNFTNSYTRYFNTKRERNGPLFEGKFKSIRIENEEQLLHVCRYIHLNPYTSYVVKTPEDLENYPYSSFPEYLGNSNLDFCAKGVILGNFKNLSAHKQFIFDQADYQRTLNDIKHLLLGD